MKYHYSFLFQFAMLYLMNVYFSAFQFYCMLIVYYYHLQLENFDSETGSVES